MATCNFAVARARRSAIAALLGAAIVFPCAGGERSSLDLKPVAIFDQHLYEGNLSAPRGVAFDAKHSEVIVADTGNNLVGIFTPEGTPLFAFPVKEPLKVIAAPDGKILVLSGDRSRILQYTYRGQLAGELKLPNLGEKPNIAAMAFSPDGLLYIGNGNTGEVMVFSEEAKLVKRFGSRGIDEGQFLSIAAIAVDDRNVFVLDHTALAVQVFDRRGNYVTGWGRHEMGAENVSLPEGIALDSQGHVILVDQLRHEIKYFDREGKFVDRFGGMGEKVGQVSFPTDVAVGPDDHVYVVDRGNARVQAFELIDPARR